MTDATGGPIAYLTGEYPRATDTFIQREVAGLRAQGLEVMTCSIRRTGAAHLVGPEQKSEAARTFHVLEACRRPAAFLRAQLAMMRAPARYLRALALAWRTSPKGLRGRLYQMIYFAEAAVLARHLKAQGIRHLHNHIAKSSCTVAMLTSALSGIPFSFTLHGPDIFFAPDHWALRDKIRRARFVACISHFCRSQAMAFSAPQDWDKLHIVHCGVEPERYAPDTARTAGAHVLFVGRLADVKGVPILLEALAALRAKLPALRATLIGDGPDRAALEALSRQLGLSDIVDFAGYKSQAEVAEALSSCDLFVLPSFAEGLPVVLMEALAAARPALATRIAGIPELIRDGATGRLVPPGDREALPDAMLGLLQDPEGAAAMGRAGRALVQEEFDVTRESAWLAKILESYQGGNARPGLRPNDAPGETA